MLVARRRAQAADPVDVDAPRDRRGAELRQRVPDDDVGDVVALDHVEHVVDVGRRRVHQRAAGAQHLQRGGDAAHPERRQQRHRAVVARHEEDRRQRPRLAARPPTGRAPPPSASPCCPTCRRRTRRRPATPRARRRRAARRRARPAHRRGPGARRPVGPTTGPSASSSQTDRRYGALEQPQRAGVGRRRSPGSAAVRFAGEVAAQEPTRADEDLGVARAQDVRQLGRRRQRADRRDERADAQRGVERREPERAVGRQQRRSACPCRRRSPAAPAPCAPSADRARA